MADVTKSIGTTARDYSTITLWFADLDNGGVYSAGDDAIGEMYDDSVFDENVTVAGGETINLASRRLTVASGERHDGTAGSGARLVPTSPSAWIFDLASGVDVDTTIEWFEMDGGDQDIALFIRSRPDAGTLVNINHMILHDTTRTNGEVSGFAIGAINGFTRGTLVHNCIIYNIILNRSGGAACRVVYIDHDQTNSGVLNTTVHNCGQINGSSSGPVTGVQTIDVNTGFGIVNNICTDVTNAGSGTVGCYEPASPGTADMDHNLSSDATASGTGSLTSKTAANQYVSTVGGSEDLHLKSGADAIDTGADLGTTPSGVEVDIDGRDRDALGDTWDMGADELVAAAAAGNPWYAYAQQ